MMARRAAAAQARLVTAGFLNGRWCAGGVNWVFDANGNATLLKPDGSALIVPYVLEGNTLHINSNTLVTVSKVDEQTMDWTFSGGTVRVQRCALGPPERR